MDNKYKKGAFIISLILFAIMLPLTIIGMVYYAKTNSDNDDNEFYYNGKLYFYDTDKTLLGTYQCMFDKCGYAKETIDDSKYDINYYKSPLDTDKLIDKRYALIADYKNVQNGVILYDIKTNKELGNYKEYKIYNIGLNNNYIIVKALNDLYGIIQVSDGEVKNILPFEYDFVGLKNKITDSKIDVDNYIVFKDELWSIIDNEGDITIKFRTPIVDYNESSIVVKNTSGNYNILNYDGSEKIYGEFKKVNYLSGCITLVDMMDNYYAVNSETLNKITQNHKVASDTSITSKVNEYGNLEVIINNQVKEVVDIN